ncbi:protein kinase [Sphaerisporangium sp. NPDC088356]|uniref:serine/threonine protein kinase n=1 Tax=Sphaerisporangium sp. NPDC088356 TaxID=3154871 RepID=UPI0034179645
MPAFRPLGPTDPTKIASYRVTGRIGEGGQGVVYAAESGSGERVAVKLLHRRFSDDERVRRAFGIELRQAQRVTDPRVSRVLAYGIHDHRLYYAGQYIEGPSLWEVVEKQGPRPESELDGLATATLAALAAIHEAGTAHGDFRPGCVLLGPDGPRVIDFGVGRALDGPAATGLLVGTSPFTAPEHLAGTVPGPESDMFAWAGTMVYAATGRAPFGQDSVPAVINRILNGVPDLSSLAGSLLGAVEACLDKTPARRPSARELLARLERPGSWSASLSPLPRLPAVPPAPGRTYPPPAAPRSYEGPIPLSSRPMWPRPGEVARRDPAPRELPAPPPPPSRPDEFLVEAAMAPDRQALTRRRRRGRRNRALVVAALTLVAAVAVALFAAPGGPADREVPGVALAPTLGVGRPPTTEPAVPPTIEPTPVPSPSASESKAAKDLAPSWKATTTRVARPVLAVTPVTVRVQSDYIFYVNIRLKAPGAAVRWRASITEGGVLSSTKGQIDAGGSAVITAYGTPYCSTSKVRFTSNGGDKTVTIIWGGVLC